MNKEERKVKKVKVFKIVNITLILGGVIMGYIAGQDRGQVTIFSEIIHEYISDNIFKI